MKSRVLNLGLVLTLLISVMATLSAAAAPAAQPATPPPTFSTPAAFDVSPALRGLPRSAARRAAPGGSRRSRLTFGQNAGLLPRTGVSPATRLSSGPLELRLLRQPPRSQPRW